MEMSSSRSLAMSSLRIPYRGVVEAMGYPYLRLGTAKRTVITDFYYSAGEGDRRRWADMVRHGFISAGGGRWDSRTLRARSGGDRVWAHIPKAGYVGVGVVTAQVVPVRETELMAVELEAPAMDRSVDDP